MGSWPANPWRVLLENFMAASLQVSVEHPVPVVVEEVVRAQSSRFSGPVEVDFHGLAIAIAARLPAGWWVYKGGSHVAIHQDGPGTYLDKFDKGRRFVMVSA